MAFGVLLIVKIPVLLQTNMVVTSGHKETLPYFFGYKTEIFLPKTIPKI